MLNLRIDPELKALIRPLNEDEKSRLKASILKEGCLDPLKAWNAPEGITLLDGHNRYDIFQLHPDVAEPAIMVLEHIKTKEEAIAWMLENQRGRRNLTIDQKAIQDMRSGSTHIAGFPLKSSQAKILLANDPEGAADVEAGRKSLTVAYNEWRLRENPRACKHTPKRKQVDKGRIHVVIGDTQIKPGVPTQHLSWIGQYIVDQFNGQNVAIIHLGDHWDMPSLSSYDQGKKEHEGRRYAEDVKTGNEAFAVLNAPIAQAMLRGWKPERHFLFGNHEERIVRACNDAAELEGKLSLDDLDTQGWTRHKFLEPVWIDGIAYAHYFYHPNTGKPFSGENLPLRLKNIGHSFTMGHQQGIQIAVRTVGGKRHHGLVLGSTYVHDEKYLGPQATAYYRGIVVCHQVKDGQYDPMWVSLDYLCSRYEGKSLNDWLRTS